MKTYDYKKFIDSKMEIIGKEDIVVDVGGGKRFQKWLKPYESLFAECEYKTMDLDASSNPDIIGDIHKIPLQNESVNAVICSSVLEHVNDPIRATQEMYRILKKGGKMFIFVPSIYPYHSQEGHYPDMWRFFDDSLIFMCKDFSSVEICKYGGYFKAMSFFMPMQHRLQWLLGPVATFFDSFLGVSKRHTTAGYYIFAIK